MGPVQVLSSRSALVSATLLILLSGCSPAEEGVVAVSQHGSTLRVAIVPCDNEHIRIMSLFDEAAEPDDQGDIPDLGRLEREDPLARTVEFDPADPGEEWSGSWTFQPSDMQPGASYVIGAGGGSWTTTDTKFTLADLDEAPEGTWLYADTETAELHSAASVNEVIDKSCES